MPENNTIACIARNINDVLYQLKTVKDVRIVGGCTRYSDIPDKILPIRGIPELSVMDKHERFIDFGPAVTLGQILSIGEKKIPSILYDAAKSIANPSVRNLATLGGNICSPGQKLTLYAPLLALGVRLELQSQEEVIHIPFTQFTSIPQGFVLTRIRVPIDDWDVSLFRRLGPSHLITPMSASYAFLATTENGLLNSLRIAFAGPVTFRSLDLENRMMGTKLPIAPEIITSIVHDAERQFDAAAADIKYEPLLKLEFLKLISYSFDQLT